MFRYDSECFCIFLNVVEYLGYCGLLKMEIWSVSCMFLRLCMSIEGECFWSECAG